MNIKVNFIEQKLYSHGKIDVSSPWNDVPGKDTYTYEIYDEDHDDIRCRIDIVDFCNVQKMTHVNCILATIKSFAELENKIELYDSLTDEEKDVIDKFKDIYQ